MVGGFADLESAGSKQQLLEGLELRAGTPSHLNKQSPQPRGRQTREKKLLPYVADSRCQVPAAVQQQLIYLGRLRLTCVGPVVNA